VGAFRAHKALGLGALLLAIAVASSAQSYSVAVDTGAVVDEVNALSSAGRWNEAASLLDQALSIYPADSDLLYLRALAKAKTGASIYDALADAAAAASGSGFSRYSERDAAVLQAEFLVRLRRYDEALRILSMKALLSSSDAAVRLIRAKALALDGSRAAFVDEIRAAIERFPNDPAFPRLFLSRVTKVPYLPSERTLGELIVSRARRYAEFDPEIPVLAAPIMGDRIERENAVRAFRAAGGMSAAATLRALEYGIIDETKAINEITGGNYPLNRRDLDELVSLLRTPAALKAMIAAITSWTGWVEVDREKDAVIEERFRLTRGLVSSWELDVDQDGLFDDIAVFSDGLPVSVEIKTGEVNLKIVYSSYPEIATAEIIEGKQSRLYSFGPGIVVVSPFKMQRFIGEGREAVFIPEQTGEAMPSERYWASLALGVRTTKADGEYEDSVLNRGIVESSRGYRNGRLYSISQYQRGMIVSSKIDEDGDGRFERELSYDVSSTTGSLLTWIRIDTDGDGIFDYREQAVSPFRKEWDFDADGMIDAAQYILPDGSVRAEFSSRLDGRMDESLTVKNGRIVEFRRDGKSIALIADSNPSVTWIGKKPFDIGNNVPDGEGLYKKAGVRYRITKVGNLVFAEIVP
jgi:tetratricopeptide (TPR) repeat protein